MKVFRFKPVICGMLACVTLAGCVGDTNNVLESGAEARQESGAWEQQGNVKIEADQAEAEPQVVTYTISKEEAWEMEVATAAILTYRNGEWELEYPELLKNYSRSSLPSLGSPIPYCAGAWLYPMHLQNGRIYGMGGYGFSDITI